MVTDKPISGEFDWGDSVRVVDTAPEKYRSVEIGSVCGIRSIDSGETAKVFGVPIGSILYLVEAPDGQAIEIPERFLEAM